MRLELTTFCFADLHANHCSIEELMQLERYYILKLEKNLYHKQKNSMGTRGLSWSPGATRGLNNDFLTIFRVQYKAGYGQSGSKVPLSF